MSHLLPSSFESLSSLFPPTLAYFDAAGCLTAAAAGLLGYLAYLIHGHYRIKRPGPRGLPIIGNLHQISEFPHLSFSKWTKMYGDVYFVKMGSADCMSSEALSAMAIVVFWAPPHNEKWKHNRKLFTTAFSKRAVKGYGPIIDAEARQMLKEIHAVAGASPEGADFRNYTSYFTLNVLLGATFGERMDSVNDPLAQDIFQVSQDVFRNTGTSTNLVDFLPALRPLLYPTVRHIHKMQEKRVGTIRALIKNLRARLNDPSIEVPECMGKYILEAQDEGIIDEMDVIALIGDTEAAGTDTTATFLHVMLLTLAKYPEIQKRAQAEVDRVIGRDRLPTAEDYAELPYVQCLIREQWRFRPIGYLNIPHAAREDFYFRGNLIRKGTWIITCYYEEQMNPDVYPDPTTYKPERWLDSVHRTICEETIGSQEKRSTWLFGEGRRVCPGMILAEAELSNAITHFLWAFNVTPGTGEEIDLSIHESGLTNQARRHRLHFSPRFPEVLSML
ncbi:cytochrome P450 [Piptocephalis cylindrospora]|uniref:Cytochrome P450 n=1 Tax=Piptocephalis cylindrospora TaxID=1907219 RepID=A0A4P9Y9U0_9FUNG|nr:cytochrome P450 [Piptocephalis cylindrospora]|eukprot:RKP15211.1 cytochrome P450 [Piptocephalis cylindrospora]